MGKDEVKEITVEDCVVCPKFGKLVRVDGTCVRLTEDSEIPGGPRLRLSGTPVSKCRDYKGMTAEDMDITIICGYTLQENNHNQDDLQPQE